MEEENLTEPETGKSRIDMESQDLERYWSEVSPMSQPLLVKTLNTSSQIAIVGSNVCPVESLDYEMVENEILKEDWRSRKRIQILQYVVLKWAFALLIGVGTGLVGIFNNIAVENISGYKLLLTADLMSNKKYFTAFAALLGCNVALAVAAASLCAYVAPAAAGSGIPEVKAYLNGINASSILAPSTFLVKIFGSILGVSAGFVVGKEGPMVHTGACIASLLSRPSLTSSLSNDRDRRDLITCGAAAGVAAAFRAPVGGVLFALEEAASWWRSALLWRTFFSTAVVAILLRGFMQFCSGGVCGLFGQGGLILYDVSTNGSGDTYGVADVVVAVFLGAVGGLLGSLYNYLVNKVVRTYSIINEKGPAAKIMLVAFIAVVTTCCSYGLPWMANCIPCPDDISLHCPTEDESGNYKSFQCPAGHYNDMASLFLNTNDDAIRNLFTPRSAKRFQMTSLLGFMVASLCLGIITYGIAIPSGLFIPVILAGACYGRVAGRALEDVSGMDTGVFALLGAASLLGGTMRMTVSLCVILLELTNDLLLLPLVMLVLLVSKTVGDAFNKGVYDQIMKIKGLPYLEAHAEPYMRHMAARDACSGILVTFCGVERVGDLVEALRGSRHNGFPVIDGGELRGLVLRSHLVVLLRAKRFKRRSDDVAAAEDVMTAREFLKWTASAAETEDYMDFGLELKEEEMDMYVDLRPITNTSPYTVVETMSLAKAAILFRQLGLRHMCVVPNSQAQGRAPIVGILTRHDFMEEHILGLYPHMNPHYHHHNS